MTPYFLVVISIWVQLRPDSFVDTFHSLRLEPPSHCCDDTQLFLQRIHLCIHKERILEAHEGVKSERCMSQIYWQIMFNARKSTYNINYTFVVPFPNIIPSLLYFAFHEIYSIVMLWLGLAQSHSSWLAQCGLGSPESKPEPKPWNLAGSGWLQPKPWPTGKKTTTQNTLTAYIRSTMLSSPSTKLTTN